MLKQLRNKIDAVDKQLLKLFEQRMDLAQQVGEYKKEHNLPILNPQREKEVLAEKVALLDNQDYESYTIDFFENLMELSRQLQYKIMPAVTVQKEYGISNPRVVYQGTQGSYSEEAMIKYFGENQLSKNVNTFTEVFRILETDQADYGVLPVENTSTGSIDDVLDLLAQSRLCIVGEVILDVNHCLLGISGTNISEIEEIYSHQQGFSQSSEFLKDFPHVKQIPYFNTAISAKYIKDQRDKTKAAIASKRAAQIYFLDVLAENINKKQKNHTRFIILSKEFEVQKGANKISLAFTLGHKSGTLYNVLSYFAKYDLNLLHIESRPLPHKNFEYLFYVDFSGHLEDEGVKNALELVTKECSYLRILGYIRGETH